MAAAPPAQCFNNSFGTTCVFQDGIQCLIQQCTMCHDVPMQSGPRRMEMACSPPTPAPAGGAPAPTASGRLCRSNRPCLFPETPRCMKTGTGGAAARLPSGASTRRCEWGTYRADDDGLWRPAHSRNNDTGLHALGQTRPLPARSVAWSTVSQASQAWPWHRPRRQPAL